MGRLIHVLLCPAALFSLSDSLASDVYDLIKKYKPEQVADLMIESDLQYRIETEKPFTPLDLGEKSDTLSPVNVFLKSLSKTGVPIVMLDEPGSLIKAMFTNAEKALKKKNYWKAADIYQSAVRADQNYFKSYTYLGYCYLRLKKRDKAVSNLLKAVQLNPIDYQAYLYLAQVYDGSGKTDKAEEMITHAYLLAKHDPEVNEVLQGLLRKNKKVLKANRMLVPGNYSRSGETVTVQVKQQDMGSWSMLLQTLAVWENEFVFKSHNQEGALEKYKHALLNHAIYVRNQLRKGTAVSEKAKLLSDLIYDKEMLDPITYWEIGACRKSDIIQRLPEKTKKNIVTYIRQHVFEPAR